jgi:hypothetical protein
MMGGGHSYLQAAGVLLGKLTGQSFAGANEFFERKRDGFNFNRQIFF